MQNILIFDYDGVLVDSLQIFMREFLRACRQENVQSITTENDFLHLFDNNMYESMMNLGMTRKTILRVVTIVKKALLRNESKIHLFPGISETLHHLAKTNILLISTSNDTEVVQQFMDSRNLNVFADIYGSDREPSKIKKIQAIKTSYVGNQVFYIGDTKGDILEGKQAGINTVAVTWGWHEKHHLQAAQPDYLASKPRQLLDFFSP
jgi:phosphoglycolate phosphatase